MAVESWKPEVDGEFTEFGLRCKLEARGYEVNGYVYPPGTRFPDHTHPVDKIDAVVLNSPFLDWGGVSTFQEIALDTADEWLPVLELAKGARKAQKYAL